MRADFGAIRAAAEAPSPIPPPPSTTSLRSSTTAPAAEPTISDADALDQARSLWIKAIDAEAKHNYPAAVHYYEQIKKLPSTVWPAALDLRLQAAKKQR